MECYYCQKEITEVFKFKVSGVTREICEQCHNSMSAMGYLKKALDIVISKEFKNKEKK